VVNYQKAHSGCLHLNGEFTAHSYLPFKRKCPNKSQ